MKAQIIFAVLGVATVAFAGVADVLSPIPMVARHGMLFSDDWQLVSQADDQTDPR